jgi:hypothetical protein
MVRYTKLTQMASFTAKIIFDAISQWHPTTNQQKTNASEVTAASTEDEIGAFEKSHHTIVSGTSPKSVRRLMPLRARSPSRHQHQTKLLSDDGKALAVLRLSSRAAKDAAGGELVLNKIAAEDAVLAGQAKCARVVASDGSEVFS